MSREGGRGRRAWLHVVATTALGLTAAAIAQSLGADRLTRLILLGTAVQTVANVLAPDATRAATQKVMTTVKVGLELVLGTLTWVFLVLPAWAISRVTRLDQLRDGSGWKAPGQGAPHGRAPRPYSLEAPAGVRRRMHGLLTLGIAAVVVASLWLVRDRLPFRSEPSSSQAAGAGSTDDGASADASGGGGGGDPGFDTTALADQPHAEELVRDIQNTPLQFDPAFGYREREVDHRWIHVKDRVRRSYVPEDPVRRVWVIGGSAAFGIGQRDEFTIPSELAKLSEEAGVPVEFENFGMSAYNAFQESQLLSYLLATRPHPDLIVVYDGYNDVNLAISRISREDPHLGEPVQMLSDQIEARLELDELAQIQRPPPQPNTYGTDEQAMIDLGVDQYRAGSDAIRLLAKGAAVPVLFAWQPSLPTLDPVPPGSRDLVDDLYEDDDSVASNRRITEGIRAGAVPEGIDLSSALDGTSKPIYLDWVHTNEAGAHRIATKLWPSIEQALDVPSS